MKAYVINIPTATDRLERFQSNYPACLPACTVWNAKTGEDVTKPVWWKGTANRWALVQNFIEIFDANKDGDESVLIFEDDCLFCKDFESAYNTFMAEVPQAAEMIYLGTQPHGISVQVSEHVLRLAPCFSSHAIIYTPSAMRTLYELFTAPNWDCKHFSDQRKAQAIAKNLVKAYSPIVHLCGQGGCYSYLTNSVRPVMWFNDYQYYDMNGKLTSTVKPAETAETTETIPEE